VSNHAAAAAESLEYTTFSFRPFRQLCANIMVMTKTESTECIATRELQRGYYRGKSTVIRGKTAVTGNFFCEITAVITGMGTALTGIPW